jgi:hypothetical protein
METERIPVADIPSNAKKLVDELHYYSRLQDAIKEIVLNNKPGIVQIIFLEKDIGFVSVQSISKASTLSATLRFLEGIGSSVGELAEYQRLLRKYDKKKNNP